MQKKGIHIGIILDGNRRYAEKRHMPRWQGHSYGAKKVEELIKWCRELNVRELTLYSFSIENFNRQKKETEVLFKLFRKNIAKLKNDKKLTKNNVRINFIGRIEMFPSDMAKEMREVMEKTKKNKKYIVNFAMAYSGRAEIVDAVKKIALDLKERKVEIKDIDEKTITKNLYLADEPDLIIRPGGEKRASNFLIWQGYYSEWYFTNKLWPEFTKKDLIDAISDFEKRERRFGR